MERNSCLFQQALISRTYFHKPTERPWNFRIFGYGHDLGYWRNVFAELRRVGYEYVASIEFECELSSADFGCRAALKNLKDCILTDDVNSSMSWLNHVNRMRTIRNDFYGIGK